jgi:HK97 family phage portal protein
MGWFDRLFRRAPRSLTQAPNTDGWTPWYTTMGTDVYASDVVLQALKCIVDEMKKLNPTHIRVVNGDPQPVKGDLQNVLNNPNELMTSSEFLEKLTWLLLLNSNAFILPTYYKWNDKDGTEQRRYEALYIIKPVQVDFLEDPTGKLYVTFYFANGDQTTVPYTDVIHIRYNFAVSEYMGGNEAGQPNNTALLKTLDLNRKLLDGIAKAMNASYTINGIVKYNTMLDDGKTLEALKRLENMLQNSQDGFLPLDIKADFIPLQRNAQLVDEGTLKFIDEKILRNWGVPLCILTGDYTPEQYYAFYQKALEPLIVSYSQAFTKKLFTQREKSFGNEIKLYPKELIFMSVEQTLEMIKELSPTGALYENEKRVALGLRPDPALVGLRYMSLNWINANNADQYQLDANVKIVDEEEM